MNIKGGSSTSTTPTTSGGSSKSKPSKNQKPVLTPAKNPAIQSATTGAIQEKFLLWCADSRPLRTHLAHVTVDGNTNDMHVFQKLGAEYRRIRGWRAIISLRDINEIRFIKVHGFVLSEITLLNTGACSLKTIGLTTSDF
jgi:hypothetical protein